MKKKKFKPNAFPILWFLTTLFLFFMLWQQASYARIINYSGLVRGGTQKYTKEELCNHPNDALSTYLDDILYDLQTGEGDFHLAKNNNATYQSLLAEIELIWTDMKAEVLLYRDGHSSAEALYELSQQHFLLADEMVLCAENNSDSRIQTFMICYGLSLALTIFFYVMLKRKNDKNLHNAIITDKLTGLLSREGFEEIATQWLFSEPFEEYVIIKFDIRDFHSINATYGYVVGDQLLRDIAHAIENWIPSSCICSRVDADNFYVFAKKSEGFVDKFKVMLVTSSDKLEFTHHYGSLMFSYGVYELTDNTELINTIMDKTTVAHKLAKKFTSSNNSTIYYNQDLVDGLEREIYYSEHLYQGILNKEFQMYLQPQLDLRTMHTVSAEALVRWKLPTGELVYPDSFIPLFESKGMMNKLDFYMLEQACTYIKRLISDNKPPIRIGVNFSRLTLYDPTFYQDFVALVDRYDVPHTCIEIEVVETALNEVDPAVIEKLSRLREIGFKVAMDDFGAGYSSLNCLSNLPVQTIKLDRQFLAEVDRNPKMKIITTSMVELAHNMGMSVLCEGVEQKHHIEFLHDIGCDYAQGYYFARPVPKEDFSLSLAKTE